MSGEECVCRVRVVPFNLNRLASSLTYFLFGVWWMQVRSLLLFLHSFYFMLDQLVIDHALIVFRESIYLTKQEHVLRHFSFVFKVLHMTLYNRHYSIFMFCFCFFGVFYVYLCTGCWCCVLSVAVKAAPYFYTLEQTLSGFVSFSSSSLCNIL